jgi:soluble lytic murein transglycosylase-like protein
MPSLASFTSEIARRRPILLFAEKPSHPSVPLDLMSATAQSRGQGRSQTGACALPLTEASPVASYRRCGDRTKGPTALFFMLGLCAISVLPSNSFAESAPIKYAVRHTPYSAYIDVASRRFRIPARWIRAVMRKESGNYPRAVSAKGALGLMQIMPDTWQELRIRYRLGKDPYDPRNNILAGAAYLRELYDRYGSPGFLAAYNAGPSRYQDYLSKKRKLPAETRAYVAALLPFIDGSVQTDAVVATAYPQDRSQSSLFVSRTSKSVAAIPVRLETPEIAATSISPREISAIVPLSDGLFVALTKDRAQ